MYQHMYIYTYNDNNNNEIEKRERNKTKVQSAHQWCTQVWVSSSRYKKQSKTTNLPGKYILKKQDNNTNAIKETL